MPRKIPHYIQNRLSKDHLAGSLRLLQLLNERGSLTQTSAAEALGLSVGTCNLHFQKLEHLGLICRGPALSRGGRGRSATVWELNRRANGFLLVLFEAPSVAVVLVDLSGAVRFTVRRNLSRIKTAQGLLGWLEQLVGEAVERAREEGCAIQRALVVAPAVLDSETSAVVRSVYFPAMAGIDFAVWMKERFDLACGCASLGAAFYHGESDRFPEETRVMVINWDMGVGMAAGVNGRIISRPVDLYLSELGHLRVRPDGRRCYCGREGCLEAYVGGRAMLDQLDDASIRTLQDLVDAVRSGQPQAVDAVCRAARQLGESLTWPLQVTGAEKLLISGPLGAIFPQIRSALEEGLASVLRADEIESLAPAATENSEQALCRGAFKMAGRSFFYPQG